MIRTASELPRKLAPRREQHRDPRRRPTPATATCPSADPRAGGPAAWTDGRTPRDRCFLPRQRDHSATRTDTRTPSGKGSAPPGALRAQSPAGDPLHTWGFGGDGLSGRVRAILAAPGSGGAGPRPKHPELTRGTGVPAARVRPRRRRCPASRPPAPRATILLGWAARHRAPYLCRRPASLRRGRRWPRGHGGRLASRAEPVRVLTSPPGALRVHPGALECSLRTCQIPGPPPLGPASHVLPWPEPISGTRPGPGEPPGSGPHGCGLRGRPGGLRAPLRRRPCHLPRRRSAASALLPGLMQLPGWSRASGSVAGCATAARPGRPDPGPPARLKPPSRQLGPRGPAEGTDGRSCSHLRSRRLACSHLLRLSGAGVTSPASSCDITCQGVCGQRRRPLSRSCHRKQGQRRWHTARSCCFTCPGAAPCGPGSPLSPPPLPWHKHLDLVWGSGWLPDC